MSQSFSAHNRLDAFTRRVVNALKSEVEAERLDAARALARLENPGTLPALHERLDQEASRHVVVALREAIEAIERAHPAMSDLPRAPASSIPLDTLPRETGTTPNTDTLPRAAKGSEP